MRRVRNVFEQESYRGRGIRAITGATMTMIICSVLSGLAIIGIVANFDTVAARIAIFIANMLSSGFPILVVIIAAVYFVVKLKWKLRRKFWGW